MLVLPARFTETRCVSGRFGRIVVAENALLSCLKCGVPLHERESGRWESDCEHHASVSKYEVRNVLLATDGDLTLVPDVNETC